MDNVETCCTAHAHFSQAMKIHWRWAGVQTEPEKIISLFKGKLWSERVFFRFYHLIRHILEELKNRAQTEIFSTPDSITKLKRSWISLGVASSQRGEIAIKRQLERRKKGQQTQPFFPHNNSKTKCLGMRKSLAEFMGKRRNESCRISPPSQKSRRNTRQ